MRIITLIDNVSNNDFISEHGLSLYIEINNLKILFDTGQSNNYILNAKKLNINLADVDILILSHGHYDHGGGILEFLNINSKARIYIQKNAFKCYYNGLNKYIGLDNNICSDRIIYVDDYLMLNEYLELYTLNNEISLKDINSYGLKEKKDNEFIDDKFMHEQYLLIKYNNKRILISGCSHKGVININKYFNADILIGGFHYKSIDDNDVLINNANRLLEFNTMYYTCHCTGILQYNILKNIMKDKLKYLATSDILEIE